MRASNLVIPWLVLSAAACEADGEPDEPCVLRAAERCDIRETECQEHAHSVIACIREAEHPLPTIEVMSPSEYEAAHPPPPPRTPAEQAVWEPYRRAYVLLGLLPPGWQEPEPAPPQPPFVAYDSSSRTITVIADHSEPDRELYGLLFTLVVADRDLETDLTGLRLTKAGTFDSKLALNTVISGEATLFAHMAQARETDYWDLTSKFSYAMLMDEARRQFADLSIPWGEAMARFQWYYGANFILTAYRAGGLAAVDRAYERRIESTAYPLAGHADIIAAFSAIEAPLPPLPAGFRYLPQDNVGPALLQMHRARQTGIPSTAQADEALAYDWVGDRLVIAVNDTTDAVAVAWQIAGPGGEVASTIVRATDDATLNAFEALFGG